MMETYPPKRPQMNINGGKITAIVALAALALPAIAAALLVSQDNVDKAGAGAGIQPINPLTVLQKRLDTGQVDLRWNEKHGWLESVLQALRIPKSSQTLVFSKTSFQRSAISPQTPRAIYFNDNTYVGYVQGGGEVLEISTV